MIEVEEVIIVNYVYLIGVPYGLRIDEAWDRIRAAKGEGIPPWPKKTLIKYYCHVITRPSGRIVAVEPA